MMILHLIKKDVLIAKKYILIVLLAAFAIPLLLAVIDRLEGSSISGIVTFRYMVILTLIILLQNISHIESKYDKVPALLCASPYTRKTIVIAKYAFFVLLFGYCLIAHSLFALIFDISKLLGLTSVLSVLLISAALYGIYLPIDFKYGAIKTRFIFAITIIIISLSPALLTEIIPKTIALGNTFSLFEIPSALMDVILAVASMVILMISMIVSMKIYEKKDL